MLPMALSLESEEGEIQTNRLVEERVQDAVVILHLFTLEESVHLSQGLSLVPLVCSCGPEIPPQVASDSKGSTLIKNNVLILIP